MICVGLWGRVEDTSQSFPISHSMIRTLPPELWYLISTHPPHIFDTSHRDPEDPWEGPNNGMEEDPELVSISFMLPGKKKGKEKEINKNGRVKKSVPLLMVTLVHGDILMLKGDDFEVRLCIFLLSHSRTEHVCSIP